MFCFLALSSCILPKNSDIHTRNSRILYPIKENNKWGYADKDGITVIDTLFDEANFFENGLALVKLNKKYGFITVKGNWHIPPKYDAATSFFTNFSVVSIDGESLYIDFNGKKMNEKDLVPIEVGGCNIKNCVDPDEYFILENGKYELIYKYYVMYDSNHIEEIIDTSNMDIDEVISFGNQHILIKKQGKFSMLDVWSHRRIVIDMKFSSNHKEEANNTLIKLIQFKFDDVKFESHFPGAVQYAKVRVKDEYGVIDGGGNIIIPIEYSYLEIFPSKQMALIEFEPNRYGYKNFSGKEYFKRNLK